MDLQNIISRLTAEIRKISVAPTTAEALELSLEKSDYLNAFLTEVPVVVCLFNHATYKFDYVSANVTSLLGIEPETLKAMDHQEFLMKYMHPADVEVVALQLFPELVSFMNGRPKEEVLSLSVQYNYRMKAAAGHWIRIEQQSSALRTDQQGKISLEQAFYFQTGEALYEEAPSIKLLISRRNAQGIYESCFSRSYKPKKAATAALPSQKSHSSGRKDY